MPALDPETRERWRDLVVVDRESATVGTIETFYLDQVTGLPTWALVHTGWLGDRRSLMPLANAVEVDGEIRVPYTKAQVREAPQVADGDELTADDELALAGHYGLHDLHGAVPERPRATVTEVTPVTEATPVTQATPVTEATPEPRPPVAGPPDREGSPAPGAMAPVVHTPSGPEASAGPGEAGLVVTRSEEELRVGLRTRLRRLRLRKYVVTEYVTRTIPVRREKVRLEELGPGQLVDGGADDWARPRQDGATELELVLHREEPLVQLRAVPVERVRLVKRVVTEQRTVTEELRAERVEVDVDQGRPRP
jgi:stress response protein YsnF